MLLLPKLRRRWAELKLALVDAEVARWYVHDGQLSDEPLEGRVNADLRRARFEAVSELERFGGRDPQPTFMRRPTQAQRAARCPRS